MVIGARVYVYMCVCVWLLELGCMYICVCVVIGARVFVYMCVCGY